MVPAQRSGHLSEAAVAVSRAGNEPPRRLITEKAPTKACSLLNSHLRHY